MQLYNSLSHKKEEFVPNHPDIVKMYTCGPTVYHFAHIGNLRTYIMEDVLEKYLRYCGYNVKRVMNITDVGHLSSDADTGEDKMLKGAKREHKTVMEIAKYYTDAFFEDCRKLNIKTPDVVEPATACIPEFIKLVEGLLEKGYAYVAGGNVYFDTSKLEKYYVFNDHNEEDLAVGVREGVEEDQNKRNKADFVLWFTKSKFEDQELKWDSPWGVGYPGWHIECSGISMKHLGEDLDIHCGGIDNAFPHHTNEIAQSEAYLGHKWCNYWFHVLHLNTNTGKMSKSKGEFLTVSLLEEKGYRPLAYRYFCLQSHYRKALVFSYENLDNAEQAYDKLVARVAALKPVESDAIDEEAAAALRKEFTDALDNDLNTSLAVTAVYDVLKAKTNDKTKAMLLREFETVLGLGLFEEAAKHQEKKQAPAAEESDPEIDALIAEHKAAGKTAPSSHPECRPNPLEAEAVAHLLRITQVADTPIVIVHLSTKEALAEVMQARTRGQKVYVETCPHYLLLDDSVYYQEEYSASARYICAPPMRKKEDQEVLWKALANGTIQTISTDHCSFTLQQKDAGKGDFTKIPGGLPGVETRGVLLYTAGVAAGRITKEQMCALLSENPARLYGAYPRKGVLAVGSDADIVVYDPEADAVITAESQHSAAGYTPYEGFRTRGSIAQVYLRGQLAAENGAPKLGPTGVYIPRKPGML